MYPSKVTKSLSLIKYITCGKADFPCGHVTLVFIIMKLGLSIGI